MARSGPLVDGRCKTKAARRRNGEKKVQCQVRLGVFWPQKIDWASNSFDLHVPGLVLRVWGGRLSRHVARRTAVLRGRTTADRTDAAAGRGCKKTHALVGEGIPGRVINRSRRGSTRNTVKTLEDRIEAPRLFARSTAADVPRVGPELAIHKLILPATSDQRGRPRGADSSAFCAAAKRASRVKDASRR